MNIFGWEVSLTREKAAPTGALVPANNRGNVFGLFGDVFTGSWQQDVKVTLDSVLTFPAVFRCISLISSDIAKMCMRLVRVDDNGIETETYSSAFSPVLNRPNRYQNMIQFLTSWLESKMMHGNAVILKERDNRGVVVALYVLNWLRVLPLIAPDGSVFYQLGCDVLAGIDEGKPIVPASEIIHDRWNTFFHPLVGLSPIFACGLAATYGLNIQKNSTNFFKNGAMPSGVVTAPGAISEETAQRLKDTWDDKFSGKNFGKVLVMGDGVTYQSMTMTAVDAQLIDQLKWTGETACTVYGVPAYKVGIGEPPAHNSIQVLDTQYYAQCLQIHVKSVEVCLSQGLSLPDHYAAKFDLDDLLLMDEATLVDTLSKAVLGGLMKPNEGRARINREPVGGGDQVYLQQQNYSLAALAKRDAKTDPFAGAGSTATPPQTLPAPASADPAKPKPPKSVSTAHVRKLFQRQITEKAA